jgi:hypothetical protein
MTSSAVISRAVHEDRRADAPDSETEARYVVPSRPIDSHGSLAASKAPPVQREMPGTRSLRQRRPLSDELAVTLLLSSIQATTSRRGSRGSTARLGSTSAPRYREPGAEHLAGSALAPVIRCSGPTLTARAPAGGGKPRSVQNESATKAPPKTPPTEPRADIVPGSAQIPDRK